MQTAYNVNRDIAVEGMPHGEERKSRPRELPFLAQITTLTIADSEAGDWVLTATDDETGQVFSLTVALSSTTEATSLDEIVAAIAANGKMNDLFTATEDGATVATLTARKANRAYTLAVTPPGSMTTTVAITQASGGADLDLGRMVAKGPGEREVQALQATSVIGDIAGFLFRTDANHLHDLGSTPSDTDGMGRGKTVSVAQQGSFWVLVEEAVTVDDPVYVRRALTSNAGRLGGFRASPDGSAQVNTIAPVADQLLYGFAFGYGGKTYSVAYKATDGTTTVADAIDGLFDAVGEVLTAAGLDKITATESDTLLTLTTDAGYELDWIENNVWAADTEAASTVAVLGTADVDTIDVSSIAEYEQGAAADGLALVRLKGLV